MKAVVWHGKHDVRVDEVPAPRILNPQDAIVRVTLTGLCGSDLHLYDGLIPTMQKGDILGHEFVGEVVEVGSKITNLAAGDRVIVPFPIACGECWYCKKELYALCDNSNPNSWMLEKIYGDSGAGIFGYSHLYGGYSGGQAEFVRVPYADVGLHKIPNHLTDEQVLFLTDILPTGYQAADNCNIQPDDTVAVWGCGPVGLLAMKCALHMGAGQVIGIDRFPDRLAMAKKECGAEIVNYEGGSVVERLHNLTGGRGPDSCIDAVGMEAHAPGLEGAYDTVKQTLRLETDRPMALRQLIQACRKGGTVSVPGVYGGFVDKMPVGAFFAKGLTMRAGQTHVQRYIPQLLNLIEQRALDATFIITHRIGLDEAPAAYKMFREKQNGCVKVVMKPRMASYTP
ncbi:glutathione-dependent formaldehyde dehydrogenase [Geomonas sp. Red32]|uniref:zinc-dependent alcohol dehydrogenase n=1 Tax=Geomonas sp. Red32 TaxID=2912856 RepID=UPI00202CC6F6|nr:zinc-dependent alcohol dehydrogenase [Geomonas sp. Red32]MCM0080747.1 glutathione-dependent formaldehyde dehydrogenase [Geomonas sp. Red32]